MSKNDIDDAFEWLIVILGIVSAIMSQYPEYFYAAFSPHPERPVSLKAALSIVPPLVVSVIMWLTGKLSPSKRIQVVAKVTTWMFVIMVTWAMMYNYMLGIALAAWHFYGGDLAISVGMLGLFLVGPSITYFAVVPRYREVYPESKFLRSKLRFLAATLASIALTLSIVALTTQ